MKKTPEAYYSIVLTINDLEKWKADGCPGLPKVQSSKGLPYAATAVATGHDMRRLDHIGEILSERFESDDNDILNAIEKVLTDDESATLVGSLRSPTAVVAFADGDHGTAEVEPRRTAEEILTEAEDAFWAVLSARFNARASDMSPLDTEHFRKVTSWAATKWIHNNVALKSTFTLSERIGLITQFQKINVWGEWCSPDREDWRLEVSEGNTNLGYWDYVRHYIEMVDGDE